MKNPTALILGITGQDGAYLADLLVKKRYKVHGVARRADTWRLKYLGIDHMVNIHSADILSFSSIYNLIRKISPTEIYNLAGLSSVAASFDEPVYTIQLNAIGTVRLIEAIRMINKDIKFYQASSSEVFGDIKDDHISENSPYSAANPYGVSKLFAHTIVVNYREAYNMFACNGITFNHESPLRDKHFVTRKITTGIASIKAGAKDPVLLGNLDARRDWGFAGDYVYGMYLMMQSDEPCDYVFSSGELHSVREFAEKAAHFAGYEIEWEKHGDIETGINKKSGQVIIKTDPSLYRPVESAPPVGDSARAKKKLGWSPKVNFEQLVRMMMEADLKRI